LISFLDQDDDDDQLDSDAPPPKLPPRDKKKLSKQINTIKKSRHRDEQKSHHRHQEDPYSIEIPSPDYHIDGEVDHRTSKSTGMIKDERRKSWSPFKSTKKNEGQPTSYYSSTGGQQAKPSTMGRPSSKSYGDDRDHIYDTMSRSKSLVGIKPQSAKSGPSMMTTKMTASTIHLPPKNVSNNSSKLRGKSLSFLGTIS